MTELDQRQGNGITVTLLWDPDTDKLTVHVLDEPAQEEFELACAPSVRLEPSGSLRLGHETNYDASSGRRDGFVCEPALVVD